MNLLFLFILPMVLCDTGWIDPYSMEPINYRPVSKQNQAESKQTEQCISQISHLHMRRIISLIVSHTDLKKSDDFFFGSLNLHLSTSEYNFLKTETTDYARISSIFENALKKSTYEKISEISFTLQERIIYLFFNLYTAVLASFVLALYVVFVLVKANFKWSTILKFLGFVGYALDFAIRYLEVVREEEIAHMVLIKEAGTVMPECDPSKMTWGQLMFTKMQSVFLEHPCKNYFKATYNNNIFIVAPTRVIPRQVKELIVLPMEYIGEGFGKFASKLWGSLPWGVGLIIFPTMLMAAILFIFIAFIFLTRTYFKVNVFSLLSFEVGHKNDQKTVINQITKNVRPQIEHRQMIEPVQLKRNIRSKAKTVKIRPKTNKNESHQEKSNGE